MLTVVLQCIPRLAEVKRLPQDILLVYVCWKKTGHFLYWPVKFGRGLQVRQIEWPTSKQRHRQNSVFDLEGSWPQRFHGLKKIHSQLCTAWTWRQTGSVPRLHAGGGSRWDFQMGFWLKAFLESLEWSVMFQALPSYLTTKYINVCLEEEHFRKYIYQGIDIIASGTVFPTLNWCLNRTHLKMSL